MATLSTVEILERLVACPTISRDSNLPLIDWVRNYLTDYGVSSHLVPDATGGKSNLFASIGPLEEDGLMLSGHTDVVPVDGQVWASDPFTLTPRDSRLHARGACDMKGFIAAVLSRVPLWKRARLSRPVHLMLSYDEEIGCLGAPSMIAAARELLPKPAAVIVGEPTGMRVATAHKGIYILRTSVRGIEAHSSLTHQGVSAIMLAADLLALLNELSRKQAGKADKHSYAQRFDPPYTTLSVNRIRGGTAINILAGSCEFDWEIRNLPDENPDALLEQLETFARARLTELLKDGKACAIETAVQVHVPALAAEAGHAVNLACAAMHSSVEPTDVPFATEGGQYQRAGWSTVVCGPGSIDQAHKPNEFIDRSQLIACEIFLERAVARQCRS